MKKNDKFWMILYAFLGIVSVFLTVTGGFSRFNQMFPYIAGFVQFAIYATAGELLSIRILEGVWERQSGSLLVTKSPRC